MHGLNCRYATSSVYRAITFTIRHTVYRHVVLSCGTTLSDGHMASYQHSYGL